MRVEAIARIILFAKNMDAMLAFYEDILGFARSDDSTPGFVSLTAGSIELSLHQIPEPYANAIVIDDPPIARESTPIKIAFEVDDIKLCREALQQRGVTMFTPQYSDDLCFCDGLDPEGNVFQITNRS